MPRRKSSTANTGPKRTRRESSYAFADAPINDKKKETLATLKWWRPGAKENRVSYPWGEIWHADFPAYFPFGETFHVPQGMASELTAILENSKDKKIREAVKDAKTNPRSKINLPLEPRFLIPQKQHISIDLASLRASNVFSFDGIHDGFVDVESRKKLDLPDLSDWYEGRHPPSSKRCSSRRGSQRSVVTPATVDAGDMKYAPVFDEEDEDVGEGSSGTQHLRSSMKRKRTRSSGGSKKARFE